MKHRILAALLAAAATFNCITAYAAALAGDLNCDGTVTAADAVMLNRLIAEDETLVITPEGIANADFDGDGILNIRDANRMLCRIAEPAETTTTTTTTTTLTTATTVRTTTTTTTTAAPTPEYVQVGSLLISPYPFIVSRNEDVTLNVIGLPNTEYDINVYYSSGASKAKGLENHTSDSSGYVSWTWQIGGKTNAGTYHIDLIGGGITTTFEFSVID